MYQDYELMAAPMGAAISSQLSNNASQLLPESGLC